MPPQASQSGDPGVAGPLGTLAMSVVTPRSSTMALRARAWQRDLDRMGVILPFAFVHDVGLLFAAPRDQLSIKPRADFRTLAGRFGVSAAFDEYLKVIEGIADSEASRKAADLKMNDALLSALLARVLGSVSQRTTVRRGYPVTLAAESAQFELTELDLAALWARVADRRFEIDALNAIARAKLFVLTLADALDVDTLRLLGLLGDPSAAMPLMQVDLLSALESSSARDVVAFSLDLLPSVLETKTRPGASTHAAFGYAGIGRRGSLDGLVLTELAWDAEEFVRRVLDDEVLYYARDQARDEARRLHYLLIDASASMRGERSTFARGLALATAKKLVLEGEEVAFRFFDARLYEPLRGRGREIPTSYVLSFKGERGRNPVRVFTNLVSELGLARSRDGRDFVVHLFTHGAHDIPRALVSQLREIARLSAVFVAPRGAELDLDYLDLLDAHWVITNETIADRNARAQIGKAILEREDPKAEEREARAAARGRAEP